MLGLGILLLVGGFLLRGELWTEPKGADVLNFADCEAAGYPVMPARQVGGESHPRQCRTPDGRTFVEKLDEDTTETKMEDGKQDSGVKKDTGEGEIIEETGRERGGCMVTGCSGQVCADGDVVTTCEYRAEYACYEQAVCERQADGQCGWTLTAAIGRCLQEMGDGDQKFQTSGIEGRVILGPTCPVVKEPPDEECADKPYKTQIAIYKANGTEYIKTVSTDEDGFYRVELPGTAYVLRTMGRSPFPACEEVEIVVHENWITADISCDTGIR